MEKIVISVGGSMINPGKLNLPFLKKLKTILNKEKKQRQILIITGGGHLAREYMTPLKDQGKDVEDRVGIACTQLNALLLASYLKTQKIIPKSLIELKSMLHNQNILICGGFAEDLGTTSDGTAAEIAKATKATTFINLTNVKGLYTKDPRKYTDAKFIPKITHKAFQEIIDKHNEKPGQHFVLDQHAAKICRENTITVIIIKGINNLQKVLEKKTFSGTTIF